MVDRQDQAGGVARTGRRGDALTKERIIAATIDILDRDGADALTIRALATRLATGAGAIYWHVASKEELLAAAADEVVAQAVSGGADSDPRTAIRSIALGLFDAIDAHPWVGGQLGRDPSSASMLRLFEGIGGRVLALGLPDDGLFDAVATLCGFILGVAGQNAANARLAPPGTDRAAYLDTIAQNWRGLDPAAYPFANRAAASLSSHDDRVQFLAGIDLILGGIDAAR